MNIPPSDARQLSYYESQAVLWHWNEMHESGGDVEAPDGEMTDRIIAKINADPRLTGPRQPAEPVN